MSKIKVVSIVGARPQFIKAAVISRLIAKEKNITEILIHTGQHFDDNMSAIFFDELLLPKPKYYLDINQAGHAEMTGRMLMAIEAILMKESPDMVLIFGDTNSTLAGALAASKLNIKIAHVEAGLRSYNRRMPEEINRLLSDQLSHWLFCPTLQAVENLNKEGIQKGVLHVGDVMLDATCFVKEKNKNKSFPSLEAWMKNDFGILTIHREASTESEAALLKCLQYAEAYAASEQLILLFPVHPRTKQLMAKLGKEFDHIKPITPLSYFELQYALSKAKVVLTDSGGVQKESYFHQVPCITLRSETEWVETIEAGWNRLWTQDTWLPRKAIADYGDGHAGEMMIAALLAS